MKTKIITNKIIGVIGAGNMGGAIIKGLSCAGVIDNEIVVFDPNAASLKKLLGEVEKPFKISGSMRELIGEADIVIFAIKPQMFSKVLSPYKAVFEEKRNFLAISIAAGKSLDEIGGMVGHIALARVMPNLCAAVNQSMTGICLNEKALSNSENAQCVREIFETVGKVMEIEEENFSAFSAVAGCSPAFTMLFIDSLASAAVRWGIDKSKALEIAVQVAKGTSLLMEKDLGSLQGHPRVLIDKVCSPGGTTIEGINSLQQNAFDGIVASAVEASYNKDKNIKC